MHCLDNRLNVKKIYNIFLKQYPNENVKYKFYLKSFKENFNLRVGRPKVDTCSKCEELSAKIRSPHLSEELQSQNLWSIVDGQKRFM